MPVRPPPELLERVLQCGGFWFDLEAGSADPSDAEGGRCSDDLAKVEASEADKAGEGEAGEGEAGGEEEARQTTQDEDADAEEEKEEEEDDDDDDEALCLFMPAGWWHWLLADSKWHVAWSCPFFPGCGRGRGGRGGRGQGRGGRAGGGGSARREAGAPGAKGKEQQKGSRPAL